MISLRKALLSILLFSGSFSAIYGQTFVNGTISANSTWTLSGSPYELTGDVTVANGATLTIEPGVEVFFPSTVHDLIVNGTLTAEGNSTDSIFFIGTNGSASNHGGAVYLTDQSISSSLDYVSFKHMGDGGAIVDASLAIFTSDASVAHIRIDDSEIAGIWIGGGASPTLNNEVNITNSNVGILIEDGSPSLFGCQISNITQRGILVQVGAPNINGNYIANCGAEGIYSTTPSSFSISGNTIENNNTGVHIDGLSLVTLTSNSFTGNTRDIIVPAQLADNIDFTSNIGFTKVHLGTTFNVAENTTLALEAWSYELTGSISVSDEVTLTLEPNVQLNFGTLGSNLTIDGTLRLNPGNVLEFPSTVDDLIINDTLIAIGNVTDSIFFLGTDSSPSNHGGMVHLTGTSAGSTLDYLSFKKMGDGASTNDAGLSLSTSDVTVDNLRIDDSEQAGLHINNGASPTLGTMEITRSRYGIEIEDGSPTISGSIISGSSQEGIIISAGSPVIDGNTIENNSAGIYATTAESFTISSNTIQGNGTGVFIDNLSLITLSNNSISSNSRDIIVPVQLADDIDFTTNGLTKVHLGTTFNVAENTTLAFQPWSYELTGNVAVNANVTLTLESNVFLNFGTVGSNLTINGTLNLNPGNVLEFPSTVDDLIINDTLIAIGNVTDSIFFIGTDASPSNHGGMVHLTGTSAGSTLDYLSFKKMGDGASINDASLSLSSSDVTVDNLRIDDSEQVGLHIDNGASPILGIMEITRSRYGIEIQDGSPTISGSIISQNDQEGITISAGAPVIDGNTISNNGTGIYASSTVPLIVSNNTISTNGIGVQVDFLEDLTLTNNTFTSNSKDVIVPIIYADDISFSGNGLTEVYLTTSLNVTENTTLLAQSLDYILEGSIQVTADNTLRIEPGVTLNFGQSQSNLTVNGTLILEPGVRLEFPSTTDDLLINDTLIAIGNATDSIFFIGTDASPSNHGGMVHLSGSSAGSTLDYLSFRKMGDGASANDASLSLSSSDVTVDNLRIDDSEQAGLHINSGASPTLGTMEITRSRYGIEIEDGSPTISGTTISQSNQQGIIVSAGLPIIDGNIIENGGTGVYATTTESFTISNNTIENNTVGVHIDGLSLITLSSNSFTGNTSDIIVPAQLADDIDFTTNGLTKVHFGTTFDVAENTTLAFQTWSYELTGSLAVGAGVTLTLQSDVNFNFGTVGSDLTVDGTLILNPGNVLEFPSTVDDLLINGTLTAQGNSTDSIFFIGTDASPSNHGGMVLLSQTSSGSSLNYVSFKKMGDGASTNDASLSLSTSDVTVDNLRIDDSELAGLHVNNGASPSLGAMEITRSRYGIEIEDGSPTISGSIISQNDQDAIFISAGSPIIDNNTLANNGQAGVYSSSPDSITVNGNNLIGNNIGIDLDNLANSAITNNIFSTNTRAIIVPTTRADDIDFSTNGLGLIHLADGYPVDENTTLGLFTWKFALEQDVVVSDGSTLTIDPGVEIWFENTTSDLIINGTLSAVGTATDSIFFIGIDASPSNHGGEVLLSATSSSSQLDYISFSHMGDGASLNDASLVIGSSDVVVDHLKIDDSELSGLKIINNSSPTLGILQIRNSQTGIEILDGSPIISGAITSDNTWDGIQIIGGTPTIENSSISNNGQEGIYLGGTAAPTLTGNTITNNAVGLDIDNITIPVLSGNSFSGNTQNVIVPAISVDDIDFSTNGLSVIHLASGYNVDVNTTLSKQTWNYQLEGILIVDDGATLTIDPGVQIEILNPFHELVINGTLNAVGTETDSIYFIGVDPGPSAHGGGVELSATSTGSLLNYVSFDHLGDANSGGASLSVNSANASIENLRIHDSEISGLELNGVVPILGEMVITSSQTGLELINSDVTIINSRFANNLTGILVNGGNPVFRFSAIEGNSSSGINNTGAGTVDAINNWWGSTTGPTNGANPSGTGDAFLGTVLFDPWLGVSTAFSGTGLAFDGVDDYVEIPDDAILDITGAITLETWVRFDEPLGEETPLISKWNPDATPEARSYTLFLNNTNEVWMGISTDGTTTTEGTNFSYHNVPYPFEVGKWYHIAGTFSPSSSIVLYVNGRKIGEKNFLMVPSIHADIATLNLGSNSNTTEVGVGSVSTGVGMTMDEIRIWSEAREEGAIRNTMFTPLTGNETNLAAYYNLNESSGILVTDLTANANNGTLFDNNDGAADGITAGPLWSGSGAFTPLLNQPTGVTTLGFQANWLPIANATNTFFDIDDNADFSSPISLNLPASVPTDSASVINQDLSAYVGVPLYLRMGFNNGEALSPYSSTVGFMVQPGNALDFDGNDDVNIQNVPFTGNFTIETWFKTTQTDGLLAVINQNDQSINTLSLLSLNASGQVKFLFREPPGNSGGDSVQSVSTLNNDQWHHVAGVYDGLNLTLYVDGVQEGQVLTSAGGNYVTDISLGKNFVDATGQYIGQLDEFRVWNVARTEADIQEILYTSLSGVEDGLVAYYTFDQGLPEGTNAGLDSLIDQSGNTYHGTLNGFALTGTTSNWVTSGAQQSNSPPVAPTNLHAYSISNTEIHLEWTDNSTDETSFLIERANDYAFSSGVNSVATLSANSTSHVFNVGADRSYFFRITAQNGLEDASSISAVDFGETGGFPGSSLQFDGVDDYVDLSDQSAFDFIQNTRVFSIEAWVKGDDFTINQYFLANGYSSGQKGFTFFYNVSDNTLRCTGYRGVVSSWAFVHSTDATVLQDDEWHHIAITDDGASAQFYIDGVAVSTNSTQLNGLSSGPATLNARIGENHNGVYYTGLIDELRVWNVARSSSEIGSNLYTQLTGKEQGLLAYYSFNENTGTTLTDETPEIKDGNLIGGPVWQLSEIPFQFTVTSTNDSGPGTLRQALINANASSADTVFISFDLPLANDTIKISSEELPALSGYHLILDGTTQPGWDFVTGMLPTIKDDGCTDCDGITSTGGSAEIYGLRIDGFDRSGIDCFIPAGPLTVGAPNKGNIIVNNGNHGIVRNSGTNLVVQGNHIGIDWDGTAAGNGNDGIFVAGGNTPIIGGLNPGEGNVISGNSSAGFGKNTAGNVQILGNYIGTDPTGTVAVPNGGNGIFFGTVSGSHDVIGNIISGNGNHGIHFQGNNQDTVKQNKIGVNINGDPLGNGGNGVFFGTASSNNIIGGPLSDANTIANNGENGIRLNNASSISNFFLSNEIYGNALEGILMIDPATNAGIVPPIIEEVTANQVSGTGVDGHRIQLFLSDGSDQAIQFLDSADVSGGQWTVSGLSLVPGDRVVATATDLTNGTSEFSYQYLDYPDSIPPGSALAFDGVNDYVTVPDDPSLDFGSDDFTVEYWVRKNASASNWSNVYGVSKWNNQGGNPGGNEWNLNIGSNVNDDNPVFVVEIGTNAYAATADRTLTVGDWYHLAGVKEGNQLRIYINGELVGSQGGASGSINNVGRSLNIARNDLNSFFYSNADFDEVRIWRTALDQQTLNEWKVQEVNETHPTYDQLVSYFQFDEGVGTTLFDVRHVNDGTLQNMAADDWIESGALDSSIVNDNALAFDGIDDQVNIPENPTLQFGSGDFTIEAWIYYNGIDQTGCVVGKRNPNSPFEQIQLRIGTGLNQPAGKRVEAYVMPDTRFVNGTSESPEDRIVTASTDLTVGWHHIAMVEDYDTDLKLYVDGELVGTDTDDHLGKSINITGQDFFIGASSSGASLFSGIVDEVRIWNTVRSQLEIQGGLQQSLNGDEAGLVAYYPFDQGFAEANNSGFTTLPDRSQNSFTGTLNNFALNGTTSNWVSSGGFNLIPGSPINLITTEISDSQVDLNWEDQSFNETGFAIFRSDGNNSSYIEIATVAADVTAYSDNTVLPDNNYFYYVVARNSAGDSSPSNESAAATFTPPGNTLTFDGVDDFVTTPILIDATFTSMTWEVWVYPNENTTGTILSADDGGFDWDLYIENGFFGVLNGSAISTTTIPADLNTWQHIAVVFNGTQLDIYKDGVLSAQMTSAYADNTTANTLTIGRNPGTSSTEFTGVMDEVRIWNTSRLESEIQSTLNSELIGDETGLLAYYKFDQIDPLITVLPDRSINQNDGTLINFGGAALWTSDGLNFTVDTIPPVITVDIIETNVVSPELTGTVDDPSATIDVTANAETFAATNVGDGSWTLAAGTLSNLVEGTYEVEASATDSSLNVGVDASTNELIIDLTAPSITVNTLNTSILSPELTGTVNDPTAGLDITVNGETVGAVNNGDGTWALAAGSLTALTPGTYEVEALATDNAGNIATDATSNELIVDDTAPTISINSLETNSVSPELSGTIDDPDASIELTVNGETLSAANNGDGTWTLAAGLITDLPEGVYEVSATATDLASNSGSDASTNELEIDLTSPSISVDTQTTATVSPGITGTVDDPTATIDVTVNGETVSATNNGDGTWQLNAGILTDLPLATYDVGVTATDLAGNAGADVTIDELTIDNAVPSITVNALVTNNTSPELTGTIDDPLATISITVNAETVLGINNGDGTWTLAQATLSTLPEGSYNVQAEATDLASNTGTDGSTNELEIDLTAPVVTVDLLASNTPSPALSGTINDPVATLEVTVDAETVAATNNGDGTWQLGAGILTDLLPATYDVIVTATDPAGNIGIDGTVDELTIDNTVPVVTVDPLLTNTTSPELTGTIDDLAATIGVTVNGETIVATNNGDGTWTLAGGSLTALPEGVYNVLAEASDPASNTGTDGTTNELEIDLTAPVVSVNPSLTNVLSPLLEGTVDDPSALVEVTVNGETISAANNGDGTWTLPAGSLSAQSAGIYEVIATATDGATNSSTDGTTNELEIDDTPPVITITPLLTNEPSPELSGNIDDLLASISITVNGETLAATNNGDGRWALPAGSITALTEGTYEVLAEATDQASNIATDGTIAELEIDLTAPVATVDPLTTVLASPELSGAIDDIGASIDVTINGSTYSATNNGDGSWTLAAGTIADLLSGSYDVLIDAIDLPGNLFNANFPGILTIESSIDPGIELDSLALLNIYDQLGGAAWTRGNNWRSGQPMSAWDDVTLANGRVTALELASNNLTGAFPSITEGLDLMTDFDVSGNELNTIGDISAFTGLVNLDVSSNNLQFGSLEPLVASFPLAVISPQSVALNQIRVTLEVGSNYTMDRTLTGANNVYSWTRNGLGLSETSASFTLSIDDFSVDGTYVAAVTNSSVPGLTISTSPIILRVSSIERDSAALRAVYDALVTSSSTVSDWTSLPISEWDEVTITSNRIVDVDLSGQALSGSMPIDLIDLKSLQTADFSNNEIMDLPIIADSLPNLTEFDVRENRLHFDDLEPNVETPGMLYSPQKPIVEPTSISVPVGSSYALSIPVGGSANSYQWLLTTTSGNLTNQPLNSAAGSTYSIQSLNYTNMGNYVLQATSGLVSGLVLESSPQEVVAHAVLEFIGIGQDQQPLSEGRGEALGVTESGQPYDSVGFAIADNGQFLFDKLQLGDYVIAFESDAALYVPTFYESTDLWQEADVLQLRDNLTDTLFMIQQPTATPGEVTFRGIIEAEFRSESDGRILARRKVKKAGCSLRRRTRSGGGRPGQEFEYILYAYVQSNDNGEFIFNNIEEGYYRLNIEYPGIPMDESSFVEFQIGGEGLLGQVIEVTAYITEDGIEVELINGTGFASYFKDLRVYPNPASDDLNISYSQVSVDDVVLKLMDMSGNVLKQQIIHSGSENQVNWDTSSIPSGLYILSFEDQGERSRQIGAYKVYIRR